MIRKTLVNTKSATFSVLTYNKPSGTGFFVSENGYFITASHVITEEGKSDGTIIGNEQIIFFKETSNSFEEPPIIYDKVKLVYNNPIYDIALFKVDFEIIPEWIKDETKFSFVEISIRELEEGESIYAFGYPLSTNEILSSNGSITKSHNSLSPRTTSAIISSKIENTELVMSHNNLKVYVLDKALNYGNSGGPIISTDNGNVHAFCSSFQPVFVPQNHLKDNPSIMIPSLYGVVISLSNSELIKKFTELNIPLKNE
jgi:S1-C subfamily serine protease